MYKLIDLRAGRVTRRGVLALGGVAAASATALSLTLRPSNAAAATKESQKLARYQSTPKGKQRCDSCLQWRPTSSCVLVDGEINPAGWCLLYAPKG